MKKIAISLVGLMLASNAFALSARIGGFAALDLLDYLKVEDQNADYSTGIGVLDMKAYARHKDFSSKVKFDLDSKGIKYHQLDLVEEFTVSWQPNWDWKLTAGKGKAKFHRLHWGVTEHCYTDGGTILNPAHKYRDLDRRPVFTVRYGNYRKKYMNHFSIFGRPSLPADKSTGTDNFAKNYKIDFSEERGFTNMFEFFPTKAWSFSVAGLYYKWDQDPHANYAFDAGGRYRFDFLEVWFEYVWGREGTKAGYNKYAVFNSYENTFQIGAQYEVNDLIDILFDVEGTMVRWVGYNSPTTEGSAKKPYGEEQNNFKVDMGVKFKVADSTQITVGSLFEKQFKKEADPTKSDVNTWAYQVSSGLSIWF